MTFLEEVDGRSITVRNIDYTIEVLSGEEIDDITGEKVFGVASDEDSKIYLRAGMNDDRAEQVLTHELVHAMFFESGYTFKDEDQEEEVVEALSLVIRDMTRSRALSIHLDDSGKEFLTELMEGDGVEFIVGEPEKADPDDPRFQPLGSPTFEGKPLFKAPLLFCNNEEFDPNKHYKKPNMNFEDKTNESKNLNMFLVNTLWDTYTVNTYGKNRIDVATENNLINVQVYDFQTKKYQSVMISSITHVVPLETKEEN
ncbi:peptidase [Bacillus phage Glittering]|uniref:Uncharacterized protein n=1 Tax=Bacillus phage Glittering TaxID=2884421 RepID=U5PXS3_9CAUD|nr:peptidase [Bacillus phage Glittering]AGY47258.1 hypothetical protein Glittering_71 [Bacillus phage Glittering]